MYGFSAAAVFFALAVTSTGPAAQASSYAGEERREIKALSADEVRAYLAGSGAGFAKAAELNHYPGPSHVLELADKLRLSEEQKSRTRAVFGAMQQEAMRQGKALVEREQDLDRRFASGAVTPDSLRSTPKQIAELQAEVRRSHLQAHIEQRAILTPEQVAKYDELRGYTSDKAPERGDRSHKH